MLGSLSSGLPCSARLGSLHSRPALMSCRSPLAFPSSHRRYTRLSRFWLASGGRSPTENEDAHAKLIRAGYLRQSHAGIFHMLPLGLRVQQKLESLIDKHMSQVGASKVSLSSISSQALWEQTNRLEGYGAELFRFEDRKQTPYLLAPTHEEEITSLVSRTVRSYKDLPLRLYQIGRKYRDEMRPRHGVLRSREFIMKDLYTFDYSVSSALSTYEEVRAAYSRLFDDLKIPYLVAEASSGDIGGDLSHEYHLPTAIGEDNVISCDSCHYVANEELAECRLEGGRETSQSTRRDVADPAAQQARVWRGVSKDRSTLVNVWYLNAPGVDEDLEGAVGDRASSADVLRAPLNMHAVKAVLPSVDTGVDYAPSLWDCKTAQPPNRIVNIIDERLGETFVDSLKAGHSSPIDPRQGKGSRDSISVDFITSGSVKGGRLNVVRIQAGDGCPRCDSGTLQVQEAVELGHTFHLGTRYSEPLSATVPVPSALVEGGQDISSKPVTVPMQMGCHGIGVSRIIGAVADHLADGRGLNWPRVIAPFEVVVIPGKGLENDAAEVSRSLSDHQSGTSPCIDVALDDRRESFPWKMIDADLIGYPISIMLGRSWGASRQCEVQCRRLGVKADVAVEDLPAYIGGLLSRL